MKIRGIIPAAGYGTRVAHLTKGGSKEMMLYEGKPAIEHTVNELLSAGVTEIVVVSRKDKTDLNTYLDSLPVRVVYQSAARGLGDAIQCGALDPVGKVVIALPDEIFPEENVTYNLLNNHIYSIATTPIMTYIPYGTVELQGNRIEDIKEKPLVRYNAIVGRYVLDYSIMNYLRINANDFTKALKIQAQHMQIKNYSVLTKRVDLGNP